jgi:2-dehydro-3-deoxyphosphogluconate aldolase/(4S)-4-hydroxy-2-oxoglutarate aldolase
VSVSPGTERLAGAGGTAAVITSARLIAIIRAAGSDDAVAGARALAAAGVKVAEISLAMPEALAAIERTARELGDRLLIGAGTVRSRSDAERAIAAGAEFLVSPSLELEVLSLAGASDLLHLPGVFSPSELASALDAGARLVKLFPAARVGPDYVSDLLAPFPEARLVPTGGITAANARAFLDAGAVAVAVGSAIVNPGTVRDPAALTAAVQQFDLSPGRGTREERFHGD